VRKIQPVILAGGTGSRLWPLSRELYPKQLLQLTDSTSLLQTTLLRAKGLPESLAPIIVVGEEHRFITRSQIDELGKFQEYTILLEPVGRNTAPAICAAVEYVLQFGDPDAILLVLPADHIVKDQQRFVEVVAEAAELAGSGAVVTFGITPQHAETGYGYIERGDGCSVLSFKEKPTREVAEQYLQGGNYFWNSGMFAFQYRLFRLKWADMLLKLLPLWLGQCNSAGRTAVFFVSMTGIWLPAQMIPLTMP